MNPRELVVLSSHAVAEDIRELVLVDPHGEPLPSHPPGAHLVLDCGEGRRNAYSLVGSGARPRGYRVAVLRRPDGGGGSVALHGLRAGDRVAVEGPRSGFTPVARARRHLLVAGGIGVTPLLSHAHHAVRWGLEVEMLYVHRAGAGAYREELAELLGPRLHAMTGRVAFAERLGLMLRHAPLGSHLSVCGPGPLIDEVLLRAAELGWPPQRLHLERFVPATPEPGREFTVRLARSGRDVVVPSRTTLLEALHGAGATVPNLCRQGICGECRVPVLAGTPLHRDEFLADDERPGAVMCCVSRSETETLEVDL